MLNEIQQPGYLHVLINHLPIIGTAVGLFGLVIALILNYFFKNRLILVPALAILFLSGFSAWPVYVTGSNAYRPIMKISDDPGREWLDEHMERADRTILIFYTMAGVSMLALLVPLKWPKTAIPLGIITALAATAGMAAGGYIAQPGGLVRHTEFRVLGQTMPMDQDMEPDHHH